MNLPQLRAFAGVAEAGSVSAAAADLGLTQSAVSHVLASLERELGSLLVVRDRAGCVLTELGSKLLPHAIEALRHADRIAEVAADETALRQGRLRIAAIPNASRVLLPLIVQLRRRYPGVSVAVFEGTDQEVSNWIEQRTAEVGIVMGQSTDLQTFPLAEDEMLALVPSGHPLASHQSITVADLAGEPFLLSADGCEPMIRRLHDKHQMRLTPASRVTDMATLQAMVREGLGVSIVPRLSIGSDADGIAAIPMRPRVPRSLVLILRRDAIRVEMTMHQAVVTSVGLSPVAQAFLSGAILGSRSAINSVLTDESSSANQFQLDGDGVRRPLPARQG